MNNRHNLDPKVVKEQIENKVKNLKLFMDKRIQEEKESHIKFEQDKSEKKYQNWIKPRTDLEGDLKEIRDIYEDMIKTEEEYYSTVRIIEINKTEKSFILVYGDQKDIDVKDFKQGTGPFCSIEKATDWFTNGGR